MAIERVAPSLEWFVGLTTSSSIIMSVMDTMMLCLDRVLDLLFPRLVDSLNFVSRLHKFDSKWPLTSGDYAIRVIGFSNVYSNFSWDDAHDVWRFWMNFFRTNHHACAFSAQELAFAKWLFLPIPEALLFRGQQVLPFLSILHCDQLMLGEFLLVGVFSHRLLMVPGIGFFRRRVGFLMGNNVAPPFDDFIDHHYRY